MKGMNRAARLLKDQVGDASHKDENLQLIWAMERNAVQAKSLVLEYLGDGDMTARDKMLGEFRKGQIELIRLMLRLESQTTDGKTDDAKKTFAAMLERRDKSHDKFGVKDGPTLSLARQRSIISPRAGRSAPARRGSSGP